MEQPQQIREQIVNQPPEKKPYTTPQLKRHGKVEEMTLDIGNPPSPSHPV